MTKELQINGLTELLERMKAYPLEAAKTMSKTMATALIILNENVPPYPPEPTPGPGGYVRTGLLGRSLGSDEFSGGRSGAPDIFKVKQISGGYEGRFGTNLKYAPKVIGNTGQQDSFFAAYWWRLEQIIGPSFPKILRIFQKSADKLAEFLEGK